MGTSLRACLSTFRATVQEQDRCQTLGERLQTFLVGYGEGTRGFTDGTDARGGVGACDRPFDDPGCFAH